MASQHSFQAPTGTRDFYPNDLSRARYLQHAWRSVSVRHGFDEIDGPTFEHLELYTAKSGEGIVSELFSFERFGGEKTYALRPEFTPTLARMYAARASALPRPTKWFWQQTCFRAERPQRGRLREFYQWNCDIIGDESPRADAEIIAVAVDALRELGLTSDMLKVRISHRGAVENLLRNRGVTPDKMPGWFFLLDRAGKISNDDFIAEAGKLGMAPNIAVDLLRLMAMSTSFEAPTTQVMLSEDAGGRGPEYFRALFAELKAAGVADWCVLNLGIVRGLAYYTGMVFEIHDAAGKERAVAGGGRYDGLIEQFGGPATPAVGFGMGDAVLGLVLQEKNLLPADEAIATKLGLRPDVFVISNGTESADAAVGGVVTELRRRGLHVRRSYKATKNVGKLLQEAAKAGPGGRGARYVVIVESGENGGTATVKDLDSGLQHPEPITLGNVAGYLKG
ncbi:MAG: histidine--tRNA ligase [Pyrinomonadaceae bacterium]|nr:histidine--tRNA ligase [Phycisphaerales bacterium]